MLFFRNVTQKLDMKAKEIVDNNRKIAFFMGAKIGNPVGKTEVLINVPDFFSKRTTSTHATKDLRYNQRWDWLMPVVEKISITSELPTIREAARKYWNAAESDIRIFRESMEVTYIECVKFIDWYNAKVSVPQ
jgi:hypothetical protein